MLTAESIVMLLVNSVEKIENADGEEIKLAAPVTRWKELIGDKQPEVAKENVKTLRGRYGKSVIMNGVHGSDDPKAANKERDIFLFQIPERPPAFEYDKSKISLDTIFKFLYPTNLEHANSTGRLDLLALYGPIVNYHSVDSCFCNSCVRTAKDQLELKIKEKTLSERRKSGMTQESSPSKNKTV